MSEVWFKRLTADSAEIIPETLEDILFIRLYLREGDLISAKTPRTIKLEKVYARHVEKERKNVVITVKVKKVCFEGSFDTLAASGEIQASSDENIPQGSRHVIEVGLGTRFLLIRYGGGIDFNLIRENFFQEEFIIVSIDSLVAGIGQIKGSKVNYVAEVQSNYQGKLYEVKHESNIVFFAKILEVLSPYLKEVQKILVTGPGPLKLAFKNYLESSLGRKLQVLILEGVDIAGFDGIRMSLNSESLSKVLEDNFFSRARNIMAKILSSLYKGDGLASVSFEEVKYMSSNGACDSLLVSKDYLSMSPVREDEVVRTFSDLIKYKGSLYFLDDSTNVGIQLKSLGGLAALFRYRIR
ncbi:MAG: hypothetical protein ACUVQ8_07345 [Nitrososphaeria archaeon]